MTDKELLSAYIVRPLTQSKTPIIAYALPIFQDVFELHKLNGAVIKTLSVSDLYAWALSNDLIVEAPVLSDKVTYNDSDEKAYNRLVMVDELKRKAEIEFCMTRLKRLLGV